MEELENLPLKAVDLYIYCMFESNETIEKKPAVARPSELVRVEEQCRRLARDYMERVLNEYIENKLRAKYHREADYRAARERVLESMAMADGAIERTRELLRRFFAELQLTVPP